MKKKEKKSGFHLPKLSKGKPKKVLKKIKIVLEIPEKEIPSVLGDPNRYFKSKYEEDSYDF